MRITIPAAPALLVLMLTGCDASGPPAPVATPATQDGPAAQSTPPQLTPLPATSEPTPEEEAVLADRDCRVVAEGYAAALQRGAFSYAAAFWDDPVIDSARLAALFSGIVTPRIKIADIQEEGAAGSLYCTVIGALSDASNPGVPIRQGKIVLRRVDDVPGATEQQLRWTIRSSTFIEPMERSGRR